MDVAVLTRKEFPQIYNSEIESLKTFLSSDTNVQEEKLKAIEKFSEKFTVIIKFFRNFSWNVQGRLFHIAVSHLLEADWKGYFQTSVILSKSMQQDRETMFFEPERLQKSLWYIEKCKLFLQFPHSFLTDYYDYFHRFSASPLPKELEEQYRRSLNLYKKIKGAESDNKEWLKFVKETNDVTFIVRNIECRIASYPDDKEMWKIYLNVLRDCKLYDLMCHTYSRYCSLFVDDFKMREKFKNEIETNSSDDAFLKWKLDIVKIEKNFGTFENAISLLIKYFPHFQNKITMDNFETEFQKMWTERSRHPNPLSKYIGDFLQFSWARKSKKCIFKNDAILQNFSLPSTLIYSITKNAKYHHLQKLYGTSKYFYARLRSPLCFKIMIGLKPNKTVTFQQNLYISSEKDAALESVKKCHVKEVIYMRTTSPDIISLIIDTKIYKCEISTLFLEKQEIFIEDFLKIVPTVQNFIVNDSYIVNENGQNISVPEIIAKMPSIKTVKIEGLNKNPPFPGTLTMPKMKQNLEQFECIYFKRPNDPVKICEFLKASITSNANVYIRYRCNLDEAETSKICYAEMLDFWKSNVEIFKPNVKIEILFETNTFTFTFP